MEIIKENVKYAFSLAKELNNNLKLISGEKIEKKLISTVYINKLIASPGYVVLTNKRIIFLMHHFFGPDKLLYIPFNTISKINFKIIGFTRGKARAINIKYSTKNIIFAITAGMSSISHPKKTIEFFKTLENKFKQEIVDNSEIPNRNFDYYLFTLGALIGIFLIRGLLSTLILGLIGYIIGILINKILRRIT